MSATDDSVRERLRAVGLRVTRQRQELAHLLFSNGRRHITAEQLCGEARRCGIKVSLATVYNTLNQFTAAGLLREIVVDPPRCYFDTNTTDHHHFYHEANDRLLDIPAEQVVLKGLPAPPAGKKIRSIDVVIRIADQDA